MTDTAALDTFSTLTGTLAASDIDTADSLTWSGSQTGSYGALTVNANGSYSYAVNAAAVNALQVGSSTSESFTVTVTDSQGATATTAVLITLTGANDPPTITAGAATATLVEAGGVSNGTAGFLTSTIALTKGDVDGTALYDTAALSSAGWTTSDSGLSYTQTGIYGAAILTIASGVVSYTLSDSDPDTQSLTAGQSVTESFTVQVTDGIATQTLAALFNITGANDSPIAIADSGSTTQNSLLTVGALSGVLSNDTDPDRGDTHSVSAVNGTSGNVGTGVTGTNGGTFMVAADGSYTFNPGTAFDFLAAGEIVTTSVTSTNLDNHGLISTSTLTVTVTGTNDPPVAIAATNSATEGSAAITGMLTSTDADVLGKTASYTLNTPVSGLMLNSNGSYSFDPSNVAYEYLAEGQTLDVVANYTVTDDKGATSASTLTITMTGVNNQLSMLSVGNVAVSESSNFVVVAVNLDSANTQAVSFTPSLSSGTATVGVDTGSTLQYYNGTVWTDCTGAVTINPGNTSVLLRVAIINDAVFEGNESFTIDTGTFNGPVTNVTGVASTVTINDDGTITNIFSDGSVSATPTVGLTYDDRPTLTVSSVTVSESQSYAVASVSLSGIATSDIAFTPLLVGDTATLGADFGPSLEYFNGTGWLPISGGGVTIPVGTLSVQLRTALIQDLLFNEGTEHFTIHTGAITGAVHNGSGASGIVSVIDMKQLTDPVITDVTEMPNDPTPYDLLTIDKTQVVTLVGEKGCTVTLYKHNFSTGSYDQVTSAAFITTENAGIYTLDFGTNELGHGDYVVQLAKSDYLSNYSNSFTIDSIPGLYDITAKREVVSISNTEVVTNGSVGGMDQNRFPTSWNGVNWLDSDGETIRFSFDTPSIFDQALLPAGSIVTKVLTNGSTLSLNIQTGAYTYTPNINAILDQFTISASDGNKGSALILTFDAKDTLDRDGIAAAVETRLSSLANSAGGSMGDLNNDGIADSNQNAVTTLAWSTVDQFNAALDNTLTDLSSVISLQVLQSASGTTVDDSSQLFNVKVLDPGSPITGGSKPSNAAWDPIQFSVEPLQSVGLLDVDPSREGIQTRLLIDISRSMTPAGHFIGYEKYVNAEAIAAGVKDLDGNVITMPGWYDFTQRVAGGDGARFITSGGYITGIELTITDNAFGDNDMTVGRISDPGVPISSFTTPLYRVSLASGDGMLFADQATADAFAASHNSTATIDFYGVSNTGAGTLVLKAWLNTITGDYLYAPEGTLLPYDCYVEQTDTLLGRVLEPGKGVFDVHLYMNSAGITQIMGEAAAQGLGLLARGYTDKGVLFASSGAINTDVTAPDVINFSPNDGAGDVPLQNDIIMTFSEEIVHGSGSIVLHRGSADGEIIDVAISTTGSTLIINPVADLLSATHYFLTLDNDSILDLAGNRYTGSNTYDFSTIASGADPYAGGNPSGDSTGTVLEGIAALGIIAWLAL